MSCFSIQESFAVVVGGYLPHVFHDFDFLKGALPSSTLIFNYVRGAYLPKPATYLWCDVVMKDVHLPQNHGRDASAFYHFVATNYDALPAHVVYLHGHLGDAWHTTRRAIHSRIRLYAKTLPNAFVTLTESRRRPGSALEWYGGRRLDTPSQECWPPIFERHNVRRRSNVSRSCCATFVTQSKQLLRYNKSFYKEMYECTTQYLDDAKSGRVAFEYVLSDLLSTERNADRKFLLDFYASAT